MLHKGIDPAPTVVPPFPPNEYCESGWFYMESTGNCYYIDHYHVAGWDAAQSNCVGLAAQLASVNSPQTQNELRAHLNDPDAIGKRDAIFVPGVYVMKTARLFLLWQITLLHSNHQIRFPCSWRCGQIIAENLLATDSIAALATDRWTLDFLARATLALRPWANEILRLVVSACLRCLASHANLYWRVRTWLRNATTYAFQIAIAFAHFNHTTECVFGAHFHLANITTVGHIFCVTMKTGNALKYNWEYRSKTVR